MAKTVPQSNRVFLQLSTETRAAVDTETAAYHLNRAQQTLRIWACRENGPLRPIRISGRLAWKTDDLRRLLCLPVAGLGLEFGAVK